MIHKGLTNEQVEESRKKHGSNILTPPEKESLWSQFLQKFTDPIIRILLIALVLSVGVSLYEFFAHDEGLSVLFEPIGIFVAIMLATCIGFAFEVSANKKFEVLNKVSDDEEVKVVRNGNITVIGRKEIVVGDVVIIETGDEVPADGELIDAFSLQVNESDLTGEPMATKTIDIASISTLRKVIVVVVSIAVLHQVVGARSLIIANSHIVVHSYIFHYAIRAKAC